MLLLAWAVLLAPQLSFVHALSHLSPQQSGTRSADERQKAPEKVCDSCLALAQIGAALASHHEWQAPAAVLAEPPAVALRTVPLRVVAAFLARGPPLALV